MNFSSLLIRFALPALILAFLVSVFLIFFTFRTIIDTRSEALTAPTDIVAPPEIPDPDLVGFTRIASHVNTANKKKWDDIVSAHGQQ